MHRVVLREIARIIETVREVPERVRVAGRSYRILYLEDHRRRLEEALRRQDRNCLGMLFGQLSSKVKYQLERGARGGSGALAAGEDGAEEGRAARRPAGSRRGRGRASASGRGGRSGRSSSSRPRS